MGQQKVLENINMVIVFNIVNIDFIGRFIPHLIKCGISLYICSYVLGMSIGHQYSYERKKQNKATNSNQISLIFNL